MELGDPLKHVTVFNQELCESLADSLGVKLPPSPEVETIYGAKTKRISAERRTKIIQEAQAPRALLAPVLRRLEESGRLRIYRPSSAREFWDDPDLDWYVFESLTATPVNVPVKKAIPDAPVPEAINVWIADPVEGSMERENEWDFVGSFLFLVEELAPLKWPGGWFHSGLSSLRLIAEVLTAGNPDLSLAGARAISNQGRDRFGRWFDDHPVEKLKLVGGSAGRPRKIETVYKISYATDEQSATIENRSFRVNDLLAYPLYIAE